MSKIRTLKRLGAPLFVLGATTLFSANLMAEAPQQAEVKVDLSAMISAEASGKVDALAEGQLAKLQITTVQPVAFMDTTSGASVQASFQAVEGFSADAAATSRLSSVTPTPKAPPAQDGQEGLGFAGSSRELDILTLQYGYLLGALPMLKAAKGDAFGAYLQDISKMAPLHDKYTPEAKAQIEAYLKSASGSFDNQAYLGMLRAATQGIANAQDSNGQRLHGYLLVGLWAGFSTIASESGSVPANLATIGEGLVQMLEKDAKYGGSDQQLATHVNAMAAQLASGQPDKTKITDAVKALLSVSADG